MANAVHSFVLFVFAVLVLPAAAQEMEHPPPPKAAPRVGVTEMSLPPPGGIMVFGASGDLGLEVTRELIEQGIDVTAMVRPTSDTAALEEMGVKLIEGDALSLDDVTRALSSGPLRAVISVLGGRRGDYRVDIGGNKNVTDAAQHVGVSRLILVTAIGAGNGEDAAPWYIRYFMTGYFEAKTAAEIALRNSGLTYTIVRPGWLLNSEPTGTAGLVDDPKAFSWIARADLGKLIADSVEDEATYNKALTAFDPELAGVLSLFH
tara:strand:- start:1727 stop:2512 length:786 start_codon:yes stop_codon:yes gene_type:complete